MILFKKVTLLFAALILLVSCSFFGKKEQKSSAVARVGDQYLYQKEINRLFENKLSNEDSTILVTSYINNWAAKQLLLSKAKINLTPETIAEFEALVTNYRIDLYTRAYKEALVNMDKDTIISEADLTAFYEKEKENFKLKEKLVKLRFVYCPLDFQDQPEVARKLKRFKEADKKYLDSMSVHFKKFNFNDSLWVQSSKVMQEIPVFNLENEKKQLKKSQFFELKDSLGLYLGFISEVLNINDIAPLSHVKPTIKQVLLNRRSMKGLRSLEAEIIDEAIKKNEFELYE